MVKNSEHQWTKKQLIIYVLILSAGLLLRFLFLDQRPLHHDESLHAQYGHYFFDSPKDKFYRYDPLLHGPLLYHLLPFFYWMFGTAQWVLRLIPAIAGSAVLLLPLTLKRYFSPFVIIMITAIASLSPTYTYWSRFLNHDMLIILFMSLTMTLFLHPNIKASIRLPSLAIVIALQYCLKANAYLHFSILLFLLFFDYMYHWKKTESSLVFKFSSYLKENWKISLASLVLALLIFAYFFTSGFKYPQGFLDGLYRESLTYWWGQHKAERISGPFIYYFFVLFLYEPIFLFVMSFVPFTIIKQSWKRFILTCVGMASLFTIILFLPNDVKSEALKLKSYWDIWVFSFLICFFISYCELCYRRGKIRLGQVAFLLGSVTTIYSFAGEKVPWLALYPLFFCYCFLILHIHQWQKSRFFQTCLIFIIAIGFSKNILINFVRPGSAKELISQVHTSPQFEKTLKKLDLFIEEKQRRFLTHPQVLWPTSWYMYYSPFYSYLKGNNELSKWDYIIAPSYDREYFNELYPDYDYFLISFRQWWEPDYSQLNLGKLLKTFVTHEPWNPPERAYLYLFERKSFNREFLEGVKTVD